MIGVMDVEKEQLRAENRRLRVRVAELEARDVEREATIRGLQETVARLEALLEKVHREGKRQAAPFRKADGPRPDPKKPGRKSGEEHGPHAHRQAPPPEAIDERYEAPLPERCPHCGNGELEETDVVAQYQTEIPRRPIHREFRIHRGRCRGCGRPVQGRHALQTSDAVGAAAAGLGPQAHAAMTIFNKELGLAVRREYEAGRMDANQMVDEGLTLGCALEELVEGRFTYEPNRRLAKHLAKHSIQWFWFLIEPDTDATNYRAEQAIRPAVVNRKVWGGNRTWVGARAQSVLTSVLRTCAQLGKSALDFLVATLCAPRPAPLFRFGR